MRLLTTILFLGFGLLVFSAFSPDEKKERLPKVNSYFACKQYGNIMLTADQFLKYINQPFCAKDSLDTMYRVISFDMIYAETGLYQDSTGLPIKHTDYTFASFRGDKIDQNWIKLFGEHAYKGDTIRFSNFLVKDKKRRTLRSSNIELVIR
jgi:hypothetical protein